MTKFIELRKSFTDHLITQGFRDGAAQEIVNEFLIRFPFTDYRFSDCYKFLIDYCDKRIDNFVNSRGYNFQAADVVDLCIEIGFRESKALLFVNSGLITGSSTLKAYVTMEFLKTSYPGELNQAIRRKL